MKAVLKLKYINSYVLQCLENAPKILKNPPKHECARADKWNLKSSNTVQLPWLIGRASTFYQGGCVFNPIRIHCFEIWVLVTPGQFRDQKSLDLYHQRGIQKINIPLNLNVPLNLNAPLNLLLGTRDHYHNSLQI